MANWDDVRRVALRLPETVERTSREGLVDWRISGQCFVWELRPRRADLGASGDDPPTGPVLGARVPDLDAKEALLAERPSVYFSTRHFEGYPAVLVRLDRIGPDELEELVVEAWLASTPRRVVRAYGADHPDEPDHPSDVDER